MVALVLSIGLLIGLMFKRKEHPTNMYLLLGFVSNQLKSMYMLWLKVILGLNLISLVLGYG